MASYQYCTPEWLEQIANTHQSNPEFKEKLKKLTAKLCYRVNAEASWGIDRDIIFGTFYDQGELTKIAFFNENDAIREAEYLMAASPQVWKEILHKESKLVTAFVLNKIKLESGNLEGLLKISPFSVHIVDALTQKELQFPDQMSEEELAKYRSHMEEFRGELGV